MAKRRAGFDGSTSSWAKMAELTRMTRVLLVEDTPADAALTQRALMSTSRPLVVTHVSRLSDAAKEAASVDVVLLDLQLPDSGGEESLAAIDSSFCDVPVVVLTGVDDGKTAFDALRAGAQDYIVKGRFEPGFLVRTLTYAIERFRLRRMLRRHADSMEANLRAVVDHSGDGMVIADAASVVLFANHRATGQLGVRVGDPLPFALAPGTLSDQTLPSGALAEILAVATTWRGHPATLATLRDVTERRAETRALERFAGELLELNGALDEIAIRDPLTGLLNRRGAERALEIEARRAEALPGMSCILIDCDDFKQINDRYGHAWGDQALVAVATALQTNIRPGDHAARVGGDEFVVLLPRTGPSEAVRVAERMCAAVSAATIDTSSGPLQVTCSAGVAALPANVTLEDAVNAADDALMRSKSRGKDRVSIPPPRGPVSGRVVGCADGRLLGRALDVDDDFDALCHTLAAEPDVVHVDIRAGALTNGSSERLAKRAARPGMVVVVSGATATASLGGVRRAIEDSGAEIGLATGWTLEALVRLSPGWAAIEPRWTRGVGACKERRAVLERMLGAVKGAGARAFAVEARPDDRPTLASMGVLSVVEAEAS